MAMKEGNQSRSIEKGGTVLNETISFIRFPLIALVVFVHLEFGIGSTPIEDFPVAELLCKGIVQDGLSRLPVRLFFFISGFLFFRNADWNFSLYKRKVRSRIFTIVIPYLTWSLLATIYIVAVTEQRTPSRAFLESLSHIFYDHNNEYIRFPLIFPFWFLRDLFVVCLFTPVWHFFLKRKVMGEIFVLAMGVVWFVYSGLNPIGLSPVAVFFFCAGAYFSIRGRDFTKDFQKIGIPATVVALPLLVADAMTPGTTANWWIHQSFIIAGCISFIFWVSRGVASGKFRNSAILSGSVFMVYAGHTVVFFHDPFYWISNTICSPTSDLGVTVKFFLNGTFQILFWLGIYYCLRRWCPKSLRLLTGAR